MPSAHAPPRAPPPGRGAQHFQPPNRQLAIPPQRERGSDLIPNCAGHQAVDHCRGPHAGARSSQEGVPDSQQRDARAPAAAPTAAHRTPAPPRQTVPSPLAAERAQPENSLHLFLCGRLAPPPRPSRWVGHGRYHQEAHRATATYRTCRQTQLLGAGKTPSAQRRVHPLRDPHALWAFSLLV